MNKREERRMTALGGVSQATKPLKHEARRPTANNGNYVPGAPHNHTKTKPLAKDYSPPVQVNGLCICPDPYNK